MKLSKTNLIRSNLSISCLTETQFNQAFLNRSNFSFTKMGETVITYPDFTKTNFSGYFLDKIKIV
ncbi:pentapeptide repeat-containing protein [Trichodesmium erythraeum]|uniref:pentapeptide repeat-containing protein n=1 Tax=Trichodesmium erythraeum TaxID=1206 RepID=UPI0018C8CF5F|nr:pentapeptide repeat-containing protein [Trichodesmium erythraeum GBRTRLIN201]